METTLFALFRYCGKFTGFRSVLYYSKQELQGRQPMYDHMLLNTPGPLSKHAEESSVCFLEIKHFIRKNLAHECSTITVLGWLDLSPTRRGAGWLWH